MRFRFRCHCGGLWAGVVLCALALPSQAAPEAPFKVDPRARAVINAASSDEAKRAESVKVGRQLAEFCANCHGADGVSPLPDVPNLANQNPTYIFEQMRRFVANERGGAKSFDRDLMKALTEKEKAAVVIFFSQLKPPPARKPGPNAERGKTLYGNRCVTCHGEGGHGAELIPRIAGQPAKYLELTINHYRNKTGHRQFAPMTEAFQNVTDDEVRALIDYVVSMP